MFLLRAGRIRRRSTLDFLVVNELALEQRAAGILQRESRHAQKTSRNGSVRKKCQSPTVQVPLFIHVPTSLEGDYQKVPAKPRTSKP